MAWTIVLEDENRKAVESLSKEFYSIFLNNEKKVDDFLLLKYLNPYGDTIFNNLQADDLILDLEKLQKIEITNKVIDEIIDLVKKCKNIPHTYLVFYRD